MRTVSDFYAAAMGTLEGYIDEEDDDTKLGAAVVKVGECAAALRDEGIDDISQRENRLAMLEADLQAIIDAASPGAAGGAAFARIKALVDDITAALQTQ